MNETKLDEWRETWFLLLILIREMGYREREKIEGLDKNNFLNV